MYSTLQIAKTLLKRWLLDDKIDVFWMGLGFKNPACCELCPCKGTHLDVRTEGRLDIQGNKLGRPEGVPYERVRA